MTNQQSRAVVDMKTTNLFDDLPVDCASEQVIELLSRPGLRIERIVSTGQVSPPDFWYDEPHGEWVLVLQGEARITFESDAASRLLNRGDFVNIAPHQRHRVEWTHPEVPTIWLAVHYAE
jgi:cupin 2 domain-containing protein